MHVRLRLPPAPPCSRHKQRRSPPGLPCPPPLPPRATCPRQAHYLGFPGSLGAGLADYIIADAVALPSSLDPQFAELPVRLPSSMHLADFSTRYMRDRDQAVGPRAGVRVVKPRGSSRRRSSPTQQPHLPASHARSAL